MMWRVFAQKLIHKIRTMFFARFSKVLNISRRTREFSDFEVKIKFLGLLENHNGKSYLRDDCLLRDQIMDQAEKIISHQFNLLGSSEVNLGEKINWHADFKSGYRWPIKYFTHLKLDCTSKNDDHTPCDIKVPWELSRLQHLVVLGQAYWLSGDEKYTQEFMRQIVSWVEENPPEMGINWTCSMEISLRVISLILAYSFFRSSPVPSPSFWEKYFTLLYNSGIHIEQNPEIGLNGLRNNHYLVNCAALVWLGLFFNRYNRRTKQWLKNGMVALCKEMEYQVNVDGGSFEGSISYHRLALEALLYTTILGEKNNLPFNEPFKIRLVKMCQFSKDYLKPNGLAPQFGDGDDGRFCILSGYGNHEMRDHRSFLGVAAEYWQRNDFRKAAGDKYEDALWIFGQYKKSEDITAACNPEWVRYPDTGYYIYRNHEFYLIVKCGKIGQKNNGGHDHNDQLSFELNVQGKDLIIDPGSYVYTMDKELRQIFRSTKYHNVSQINGFEQNSIRNQTIKDLFTMYSHNPGICTYCDRSANVSLRFAGTIITTGIQYLRTIEFDHSKKRLEFTDAVYGSEEKVTCRLHLAKEARAEYLNDQKILRIRHDNVQIRIKAETPVRIEASMISPSYGIKSDSLVLCWDYFCQTKFLISLKDD